MTFIFLWLKSMQGTGDHNFRCLHNTSLNCNSKLHYFRQGYINVCDLNVDFSGAWNISISFPWCWNSTPKLAFAYLFWESNGFHMFPPKQAVTHQKHFLPAPLQIRNSYSIFQIWTIKLLGLKPRQWHLNIKSSQSKFHQADLMNQR